MEHKGYDSNQFPDNLHLLAENIPGFEMFLVAEQQQVHCKLGNESQRQGWHISSNRENGILSYFPPEEADTLRSLLKIAFEDTPVSTELSIIGQRCILSLAHSILI